jgi:hypothetical protein
MVESSIVIPLSETDDKFKDVQNLNSFCFLKDCFL